MTRCGDSAINRCTCGNGVQKFSDDSTMHGFRELYYAKSFVWKIIWFIAVVAAIALSVVQLHNAILAAKDEPTTTTIQPLNDVPQYPPLTICYLHWLYWINWDMSIDLGFTRSSTLYGMSFLSGIVTIEPFNYTETKSQFLTTMKRNNFTTLTQFYSAVSNPTPPGITVTYLDWSKQWIKVIDPTYGRLCYVAPNEVIQTGLSQLANTDTDFKDALQLMVNYSYFNLDTTYLNPIEYIIYVKGYIKSLLKHDIPANQTVDYLGYKPAPVLNVDDVRVNLILPSANTYQSVITISGSVYNWLDTNKRHCNPGKAKSYYSYCDKICYWREMQRVNPKSCLNIEGAVLFHSDTPENVCQHDIIFVPKGAVPGSYLNISTQPSSQSYNSCIAAYCMEPCEDWKYTSTVSSLPVPQEIASLHFPTILYIQYPTGASILVFAQVMTQTWETVIGNVGGILGIWLGASVLSVVQIFYLLCFDSCDEKMHATYDRKLTDAFRTKRKMSAKKHATRPHTVILRAAK